MNLKTSKDVFDNFFILNNFFLIVENYFLMFCTTNICLRSKYFYLVFNVFKYVLKIIFIFNILFLIILHVYIII